MKLSYRDLSDQVRYLMNEVIDCIGLVYTENNIE